MWILFAPFGLQCSDSTVTLTQRLLWREREGYAGWWMSSVCREERMEMEEENIHRSISASFFSFALSSQKCLRVISSIYLWCCFFFLIKTNPPTVIYSRACVNKAPLGYSSRTILSSDVTHVIHFYGAAATSPLAFRYVWLLQCLLPSRSAQLIQMLNFPGSIFGGFWPAWRQSVPSLVKSTLRRKLSHIELHCVTMEIISSYSRVFFVVVVFLTLADMFRLRTVRLLYFVEVLFIIAAEQLQTGTWRLIVKM